MTLRVHHPTCPSCACDACPACLAHGQRHALSLRDQRYASGQPQTQWWCAQCGYHEPTYTSAEER